MKGLIQEVFWESSESQYSALFDKPVSKLDETAVPGQGPNWPVFFSERVHVISVNLGLSYRSMFTNNTVPPFTVITVLCISRKRVRPFNITFTIIKIESQYNVDVQLGNPVPY